MRKNAFKNLCKLATILVAACAVSAWAQAPNASKLPPVAAAPSTTQACLPATSMKASQLFGLWKASFKNPPAGLPTTATLLLDRHAEFSESLAGVVSRDLGAAGGSPAIAGHAAKAYLAGDLDEGVLVLDESSDNVTITGTWNAEMEPASCGTVFKGVWKDTSKSAPDDSPEVLFTLTRLP